jgi:hypothetical protein
MVVCGADFVMEVVVFCGTALFFFFCRNSMDGRRKHLLNMEKEE